MKVKIEYLVDVSDEVRRGIRAYFGQDGLATRDEVKDWYFTHGIAGEDDALHAAATEDGGDQPVPTPPSATVSMPLPRPDDLCDSCDHTRAAHYGELPGIVCFADRKDDDQYCTCDEFEEATPTAEDAGEQ